MFYTDIVYKHLRTAGGACPSLRWERFPRELRPGGGATPRKKKKAAESGKVKTAKKAKVDIAERLDKLEKLDEKEKSDEEEGEGGGEFRTLPDFFIKSRYTAS